jgi:hypothetical protein
MITIRLRREKLISILGLLLALLCAAGFWVLRTQTVKQQQCLNNMRQVDSAGIQYCLEQHLSPTNVHSFATLSPYLKSGTRCPSGESDYAPFTVFNGPVCPNGHFYEPGVPRPRRASNAEGDLLGAVYMQFGFTNLLDNVTEPGVPANQTDRQVQLQIEDHRRLAPRAAASQR